MSGECICVGKNGASIASLWEPDHGCYGKIHIVVAGVSLCGKDGEWFDCWKDEPTVTCNKCLKKLESVAKKEQTA